MFFDNLSIQHTTGPITEETHYYPFGLTMAGISSKAVGRLENRYKFNDATELNTSLDVGLYETDFRLYDPQIGRFLQVDLLSDLAMEFSPYAFGNNNPLIFNDPLGLLSTKEKPEELETVYVVAKGKSKNPLNNLSYAGVSAWIDRQRELGFNDEQINDYLDRQKLTNDARVKFNNAMSQVATNIRKAEDESWKAQGELAEFIAWSLIPINQVGGLVGKVGSRIINGVAKSGGKVLQQAAKLRAAKTSTQGVNRIYSARELIRRGAEPGPFHNFPESFNEVIFSQGSKKVTPNYFRMTKPNLSNTNILYELPGSINTSKGIYEGVYQIGVRPSVSGRTELIMHRFFQPTKFTPW